MGQTPDFMGKESYMSEGESLFLQGKIDEAYEALKKEKSGRALYILGLIEREGYGHRQADEEKSCLLFEEGRKLGDPLCGAALLQGEKGKDMWDTVNRDFSRILLAANQGDVLAMDEAGLSYLGNGVILNFEEGLKWLAKGAFYEYWKALYDLGMAYEEGYASAPDEEKAMACFRKAAAFHDSESEYMLGLISATKAKTPEECRKAVSWMEQSWEHGNEEAALFLGKFYEGTMDMEVEIDPDPVKARSWYEKAAAIGNGEAMAELAFYYENGITVEKDIKKAEDFLKDAIAYGYEEALFSLALFYLNRGKEEEALPYMEASASKGEERALYMTGMMYLYGKGTEPDREKGIDYLQEAADQGSEEAAKELKKQGIYDI